MSTKKEIEQNLALIDQLIKISKNYSKKLSELSQLSLDFSKVFLQMSNSSGAESISIFHDWW